MLNWVVKFPRPLDVTHTHTRTHAFAILLDKQQVCVLLLKRSDAEGSCEIQRNSPGHLALAHLEKVKEARVETDVNCYQIQQKRANLGTADKTTWQQLINNSFYESASDLFMKLSIAT